MSYRFLPHIVSPSEPLHFFFFIQQVNNNFTELYCSVRFGPVRSISNILLKKKKKSKNTIFFLFLFDKWFQTIIDNSKNWLYTIFTINIWIQKIKIKNHRIPLEFKVQEFILKTWLDLAKRGRVGSDPSHRRRRSRPWFWAFGTSLRRSWPCRVHRGWASWCSERRSFELCIFHTPSLLWTKSYSLWFPSSKINKTKFGFF